MVSQTNDQSVDGKGSTERPNLFQGGGLPPSPQSNMEMDITGANRSNPGDINRRSLEESE